MDNQVTSRHPTPPALVLAGLALALAFGGGTAAQAPEGAPAGDGQAAAGLELRRLEPAAPPPEVPLFEEEELLVRVEMVLSEYPMELPLGFPPLMVPADNPITAEKVALGERLFFEPALSSDGTISCASCHDPRHYFTDPRPHSLGVGGQTAPNNSATIVNAAYAPRLLYDGRSPGLEDQVRYPITHPREMSMNKKKVVQALEADPAYRPLFVAAFGDETITYDRAAQALASFERTLLAGDSPFDRFYFAGETGAISESARLGWELFQGRAGCAECHRFDDESPFFSDYLFYNTGIGWDQDEPDLGRYRITRDKADRGRFRTPPLRNVARTGPYMHDGRFATLREVVAFFNQGGLDNSYLDERLVPLELTAEEEDALVAFLESLTGTLAYAPPPRAAGPGQPQADPQTGDAR